MRRSQLAFTSIGLEASTRGKIGNRWISRVSFYFVVQILSPLSLSHPPPTRISSAGCAVERLAQRRRAAAGGGLSGGVSMATDPRLVAAALFACNATPAAAAAAAVFTAHFQS